MNLVGIEKAVEILQVGELVVVPTDTVYGIACDYANDAAVKRVYEIKGRSEEKPLIVLISSEKMLKQIVEEFDARYELLMKEFWPGALTLIFKKSKQVSDLITAGGINIGVRMPKQRETLDIIESLGRPIVATSVNKSGAASLIDLEKIYDEFPELPIVDGGKPVLGVESTVLDLTGEKPKVLRQGAVSKEQIEKVLGEKII